MKQRKLERVWIGWITAFLLTGLVAGAARAQQPEPATTVHAEKDVEYGRADGESLKLDLYAPMDSGKPLHPGIVFLHGGGWSGGDKKDFTRQAQEMAERGYVAITVAYRLAPKHRYPAAVDDVQRAVRWLRKHASEYHLDPKRVGAMGASAGGHLVAMLGVLETRDNSDKELARVSSRVNCVVDFFGRMDLRMDYSGPGHTDYRPAFLGKTRAEAPELYAQASPITHVNRRTVPFLIVQGAKDRQVAPEQSEKMLAALQKAGVESSLLVIENGGHGFQGADAERAWNAAKAFLDKHLLPNRLHTGRGSNLASRFRPFPSRVPL